MEALEQPRALFFPDSWAVVGDVDFDALFATSYPPDFDGTSLGRELDGVMDDVHQGLPQHQFVRKDPPVALGLERERLPLFLRQNFQEVNALS